MIVSLKLQKYLTTNLAPKTSSILYDRCLYDATVSYICLQVRSYAIKSAWARHERMGSSVVGGLHRFNDFKISVTNITYNASGRNVSFVESALNSVSWIMHAHQTSYAQRHGSLGSSLVGGLFIFEPSLPGIPVPSCVFPLLVKLGPDVPFLSSYGTNNKNFVSIETDKDRGWTRALQLSRMYCQLFNHF